MEKYTIENDIKVFGVRVPSFPSGIGEAFESLVSRIPGGFTRSYYGIGKIEGDQISYVATAEERNENEAQIYQCKRYTIEAGEYLTIAVHEWRKKTDSIKDVFHELMQDPRTDKLKPCIEWYKNDVEMLCMMQMDRIQRL